MAASPSMNLRSALSGVLFVGNAPGDVLTWDGVGWVPRPGGGGGGGSLGFGPYSSRPDTAAAKGDRWVSEDGSTEFVADESLRWRPLIAGCPGFQIPGRTDPDWTLVGPNAFGDRAGTIEASSGGAGVDDISALVRAKTPAVTLTIHVRQTAQADSGTCGLVVRDSTTGQLIVFGRYQNPANVVSVQEFTDPATFVASVFTYTDTSTVSAGTWLRFVDDGGTHHFQTSPNGIDWIELFAQARAAFLPNGGDQCGIVLNGNPTVCAIFDSYKQVSGS